MELSILGPLEVRADGRVVSLGGAKPRALLAVLLLHRNEPVSAERLALALWGEDAPAGAVKTVQVHVSRLRKALGDPEALTTTPAGYRLRVRAGELDAEEFERLVAEAAGADHETAARRLREALTLWRGPALADLAFEPFAQTEIARLEELRVAALEQRIDADLAAGRHAEVAGELEAIARGQPLRERLQRQLMLCLYRCGRQGEALEVYRAARGALVEELGIEPGRELRELHAAILRQDPALDLASEPEPHPAPPPPRGPFVGRTRELAELVVGLEEAVRGHGRLFVIAGQPGIGKSRLAEELIAHAVAQGARMLVGRCWEAGGAPAYSPWVQALRGCVRDTEDATLRTQLGAGAAHLAQIVPELRERFRDMASRPRSSRMPRGSACSMRRRTSSGGRPGRARWSSSSTTSTPPTQRRCCCCGSSRVSSARCASSCSPRTATSIPSPARSSSTRSRRSHASRSPGGSRSAG